MKKSFLDVLYFHRFGAMTQIAELEKVDSYPKSHCDKCQSGQDETRARLKAKRKELDGINSIIEQYLEMHSE